MLNEVMIKAARKALTVKKYEEGSLRVLSMKNYLIGETTPKPLDINFHDIDPDDDELYIKNIRKVFSGKWNEKTFEKEFKETQELEEDRGMGLLYGVYTGDVSFDDLAKEINDNLAIPEIKLLNIMKVEVDYEDSKIGYMTEQHIFITVNDLKEQATDLIYKGGSSIDFNKKSGLSVRLTTPLFGLAYPSLSYGGSNVSSTLVYGKKFEMDAFKDSVEELFDIKILISGVDRELFFFFIRNGLERNLTTTEVERLYVSISDYFAESDAEEDDLIDRVDLVNIAKNSGIENLVIPEDIWEERMTENGKDKIDAKKVLNATIDLNIGSKAKISLNPLELSRVKSEVIDDKNYVLIEVPEGLDINIDGVEVDS